MPIFKGKGCKSTPVKAIDYITNPDKAKIVSSRYMDDSRDYAEQFRETGKLYGKGSGFGERKYYHFKFSCDPADGVTPEQSHKMAEKMAARSFPGHECVIATHTDKEHTHSHIIVNAINFENGKKLQINNRQYRQMKDRANDIAQEHGFTPLDWREATKDKRQRIKRELVTAGQGYSQSEKHMQQHGSAWTKKSWKDNLRKVLDEAKETCTTRQELQRYLKDNYGVDITRNTEKTIAFIHPAVADRAVRGAALGADYTTGSIDHALRRNSERRLQNARLHTTEERAGTDVPTSCHRREAARDGRTEPGRIREQSAKGELDRIHGTIREVEERAKLLSADGRVSDTTDTGKRKLDTNLEQTIERTIKPKYKGTDLGR